MTDLEDFTPVLSGWDTHTCWYYLGKRILSAFFKLLKTDFFAIIRK